MLVYDNSQVQEPLIRDAAGKAEGVGSHYVSDSTFIHGRTSDKMRACCFLLANQQHIQLMVDKSLALS